MTNKSELTTKKSRPGRSAGERNGLFAAELDQLHINLALEQSRERDPIKDAMNEIGDAHPDRSQTAVAVVDAGLLVPGELRANLVLRRDPAENSHHFADRDLRGRTREPIPTLRPAHTFGD